ncbi:MAG TPA: hypothetical protein VLV83_06910 [Acidobacteriota bacterium]|nr:hypothetical protein [Acidobacteriota bacterium]
MTAAYAFRVSEIRWGRLVLAVFGIESLLILGHFLYMAAFSYLIRPGQDLAFYQAHAQSSGPYFVIIAGIPVSFLIAKAVLRTLSAEPALSTGSSILLLLLPVDLGLHGLMGVAIPLIAPVAWAAKWLGVVWATYSTARRAR